LYYDKPNFFELKFFTNYGEGTSYYEQGVGGVMGICVLDFLSFLLCDFLRNGGWRHMLAPFDIQVEKTILESSF